MLYAWVCPVPSNSLSTASTRHRARTLADHTWVTSYDNRLNRHADISAVISAGDDFWYCWGDFYPSGGTRAVDDGLLCYAGADLAMARCVVKENTKCSSTNRDACGTVFVYRKHGVCHQLSNQVLAATADHIYPVLTVARARGYIPSVMRWGEYGTLEPRFRQNITNCGVKNPTTSSLALNPYQSARASMEEPRDEFAERVHTIIRVGRKRPDLAEMLLALRRELKTEDEQAPDDESLEDNDDRVNRYLDKARSALDDDDLYEELFELAPGEEISFPNPAHAAE